MIYLMYPYDKTLLNVEAIVDNVHGVCPEETEIFRIEPNQKSKEKAYELIRNMTDQDTLVFLGHGNTTGLHGAKGDAVGHPDFSEKEDVFDAQAIYCDDSFLDVKQYSLLKNKRIICYTCNSSEWLNRVGALSAIGFGIIPSTAYEAKTLGVQNVSEETALEINQIIDESFKDALIQSIIRKFDMFQMRESLVVFINRSIASIMHEVRDKHPILVALRKVISEIILYGNDPMRIA